MFNGAKPVSDIVIRRWSQCRFIAGVGRQNCQLFMTSGRHAAKMFHVIPEVGDASTVLLYSRSAFHTLYIHWHSKKRLKFIRYSLTQHRQIAVILLSY